LQDSTENKVAAKSSVVVMLCTLASRVLGIVKARVIGSVFGASGVADVINFTFNIPNNFRKLFAEGALNAAIIPIFSRLISNDDKKGSARLMALLCTYQTLILLPLVIVSYIYGEPLIAFFSDFDADKVALGARLLPFFMIYLATISISSIFNGLLNCHKSFFHAYLSPLLFSLSVIFGVQFFHPYYGAMSMAYATVIGGLLQGSYSYFMLKKYGYSLRPAFDTSQTQFKPLVRAWSQVLISSVMQILGQMIAFWFASSLSQGSVTALSNSMIFWQTPYGIFYNAITVVSFPMMSKALALGKKKELQTTASSSLLHLLTFLLPSMILLFALSRESVSAVLQTGNYSLSDAQLTAKVLQYYLLGMVVVSWYGLMQKVGYSDNRYSQMTIIAGVQTILDIVLMWAFIRLGYGIISMPLANALSFLVGLIILMVVLKDVYPLYKDKQLGRGIIRVCIANVPLLLSVTFYHSLNLDWYTQGSNVRTLSYVALLGLVGVLIVIVSYSLLKIPFLQVLISKKRSSNN